MQTLEEFLWYIDEYLVVALVDWNDLDHNLMVINQVGEPDQNGMRELGPTKQDIPEIERQRMVVGIYPPGRWVDGNTNNGVNVEVVIR